MNKNCQQKDWKQAQNTPKDNSESTPTFRSSSVDSLCNLFHHFSVVWDCNH